MGRGARIVWVTLLAGGVAGAEEPLFAPIYSVLQSPRCMNCHPQGDAPLRTAAVDQWLAAGAPCPE